MVGESVRERHAGNTGEEGDVSVNNSGWRGAGEAKTFHRERGAEEGKDRRRHKDGLLVNIPV